MDYLGIDMQHSINQYTYFLDLFFGLTSERDDESDFAVPDALHAQLSQCNVPDTYLENVPDDVLRSAFIKGVTNELKRFTAAMRRTAVSETGEVVVARAAGGYFDAKQGSKERVSQQCAGIIHEHERTPSLGVDPTEVPRRVSALHDGNTDLICKLTPEEYLSVLRYGAIESFFVEPGDAVRMVDTYIQKRDDLPQHWIIAFDILRSALVLRQRVDAFFDEIKPSSIEQPTDDSDVSVLH